MSNSENKKTMGKLTPWLITLGVGLAIWFMPPPSGLDIKAWNLFAIFVATIVGLILKPMPMGAVAVMAMAVVALTNTLTIRETITGFSNTTIWLIVVAFFISRGFIKTGLGARIAYLFVGKFGKTSLGLSYALLGSDLVLAPAIPSNTARGGGIIMPIIRSVCETYGSRVEDGTERKIGSFLVKTGFQGNIITAAMFLTAMAANPLIATFASDVAGLEITWIGWFTAAIVPGLASLFLIPRFIYWAYPPEIKETPAAAEMAHGKLKEMGPLRIAEKYMLLVFGLVLTLWIFGKTLGIHGTTTAFIGLTVLLVTQVLSWEDIKSEKGAWDTLVWFAALVMMASFLNKLGMVSWFTETVQGLVGGMAWQLAFVVLVLVYFYSHYFFASMTAHITAMYAAFLMVAIAAGAPPMLAALVLAFSSNLFACTTHYGTGSAPVYFGTGYVPQNTWWILGFKISLIHLVTWGVIGGIWWKVLGLW